MGLIKHSASLCILIWLFIQVSTSMSEAIPMVELNHAQLCQKAVTQVSDDIKNNKRHESFSNLVVNICFAGVDGEAVIDILKLISEHANKDTVSTTVETTTETDLWLVAFANLFGKNNDEEEDTEDNAVPTVETTTEIDWSDAFANLWGGSDDDEDTEDDAVTTVATTTEIDWSDAFANLWGGSDDDEDTEDDTVTTVATTIKTNGAEIKKGLSDELVREIVREFAMLLDDEEGALSKRRG